MLLFRRIKELVVITTCTMCMYRIQIAPTTLQRLVVSVWTCTAFPLQNNGVLFVWNPLIVETNNYYYTFNSLSIISLAKSLQLILEISTTYMYRLVSYLLADKWLICMLHTQCMYYFQSWAMSKFNRFHATVYLSLFISKQCTNKSLDFVFVISGIIKVLVSISSLGLRLSW